MQTDTIMAFQIESHDIIVVGEQTYHVDGDSTDTDDGLLFNVIEENEEETQLWFGPFDTVTIVTSLDDGEPWEDILLED